MMMQITKITSHSCQKLSKYKSSRLRAKLKKFLKKLVTCLKKIKLSKNWNLQRTNTSRLAKQKKKMWSLCLTMFSIKSERCSWRSYRVYRQISKNMNGSKDCRKNSLRWFSHLEWEVPPMLPLTYQILTLSILLSSCQSQIKKKESSLGPRVMQVSNKASRARRKLFRLSNQLVMVVRRLLTIEVMPLKVFWRTSHLPGGHQVGSKMGKLRIWCWNLLFKTSQVI